MKITPEQWTQIWLEFHIIISYGRDYISQTYDIWKGARGQNAVLRNLIKDIAHGRFEDTDWNNFNKDYKDWYGNCIFSPTNEQTEEWMIEYLNALVEKKFDAVN